MITFHCGQKTNFYKKVQVPSRERIEIFNLMLIDVGWIGLLCSVRKGGRCAQKKGDKNDNRAHNNNNGLGAANIFAIPLIFAISPAILSHGLDEIISEIYSFRA